MKLFHNFHLASTKLAPTSGAMNINVPAKLVKPFSAFLFIEMRLNPKSENFTHSITGWSPKSSIGIAPSVRLQSILIVAPSKYSHCEVEQQYFSRMFSELLQVFRNFVGISREKTQLYFLVIQANFSPGLMSLWTTPLLDSTRYPSARHLKTRSRFSAFIFLYLVRNESRSPSHSSITMQVVDEVVGAQRPRVISEAFGEHYEKQGYSFPEVAKKFGGSKNFNNYSNYIEYHVQNFHHKPTLGLVECVKLFGHAWSSTTSRVHHFDGHTLFGSLVPASIDTGIASLTQKYGWVVDVVAQIHFLVVLIHFYGSCKFWLESSLNLSEN